MKPMNRYTYIVIVKHNHDIFASEIRHIDRLDASHLRFKLKKSGDNSKSLELHDVITIIAVSNDDNIHLITISVEDILSSHHETLYEAGIIREEVKETVLPPCTNQHERVVQWLKMHHEFPINLKHVLLLSCETDKEEWMPLYKVYSKIAEIEGFKDIAKLFKQYYLFKIEDFFCF